MRDLIRYDSKLNLFAARSYEKIETFGFQNSYNSAKNLTTRWAEQIALFSV